MPPQWGALSLLLAQDGLTIDTMSQMRGVDAPTATGIITRLEQHGLVERQHDREDRRVVKIYLTDEGRDIVNTLASPVEQFEQSMTPGFPEGEQNRLEAQLQQLIANVSEIGSIPRKGKVQRNGSLVQWKHVSKLPTALTLRRY